LRTACAAANIGKNIVTAHWTRRQALRFAGLLLGLAALPAWGQAYPSQVVKLVVPQAPGGMADLVARLLAQGLTEAGKQNVVVENRPGGGTMIGSDVVAKAAPDGHTLLLGTVSLAILPGIESKMPFDPQKDLAPVVQIADVPNVLLVHKSVPANSVQELVAYAKANPGKLTYASQGMGTTGHMAGELFRQTAGIDITHVPYRGSAPAAQDLIAGQVHMLFDVLPLAMANLKNDSVKALAIAAPERAAVLPDVPSMAEAGLPQVRTSAWFGLLAPAGTPAPVLDWLNRETNRIFQAPAVRDRLVSQGSALSLGSGEAFAAYLAADTRRWTEVARKAGIKAQ
jgi:tripartite-type tricarboxylate transporter receptor subunit TctC